MRISNEEREARREQYKQGLMLALQRAKNAYDRELKSRLDKGNTYPEAVHYALDEYDACVAEFKRSRSPV